ncbi:hypothetical protein ACS0PU_005348 [Formica fusca]
MPKRCAVPNCNSNRRGEKSKRSVFRVPKDITLLKKWEEAIPGVMKLERTHVVCDKHFQAKDISREWIKCDSNGQIIAQVIIVMKNLYRVYKRVLTEIMYFLI